jgi:tetratricopeptide (TPR) repeat protein
MKAKDKHWIVLFLVLNIWSSADCQSLEETYQLGKTAYVSGDYEQAIAYYNRVLFFDQQQAYTRLIFEDLAESHFELNEYQSSAFFYDLAYNMEYEEPMVKNELLLKRALCYIYLEEYNAALMDLYLIEDSLPIMERQAAILEGMCLYRLEKFDESETAFFNALSESGDSVIVLQNFKELEKINRKSPKKAKIFSMIIPGSGLIYVGDLKNGVSSIVLVGGLASLMVVSSINTSFVNAFLNVFPWYQRYYMGGFQLTERVAKEKLDARRLRQLQKTVNDITTSY